jgi:hypothetical protein
MAGLEDVNTVDLVAKSPDGNFLLVMVEERPWIDFERQSTQLYEKVSTYLTYVLTGQLVRDYPDAGGVRVDLLLQCFQQPSTAIQGLIDRVTQNLAKRRIGFSIRLYGADFAPHAAVAVMADFGHPWFVAGGWAIDMLMDAVTRDHSDVDIAVLRRDQHALRSYLRDWQWTKVVGGSTGSQLQVWNEGERIDPPVHELHATREGYEREFLLEEGDAEQWIFRRNPTVRLPLARLEKRVDPSNAPVMAPEVVLLYKAKHTRPPDEQDFMSILTVLSQDQREWLRGALHVCHPHHAWLSRLG